MGQTEKPWAKEWLQFIDREKIKLFPLQLANCDRLEKNKAVYIFDEVGSGKTISAGLMALHYLYHYYLEPTPKGNDKKIAPKKVLVITTTQLADSKKGDPGPFKRAWRDMLLPFSPLSYPLTDKYFQVIGHDYRNIHEVNKHIYNANNTLKNNWDLVIIDEAHMFLNRETRKYEELTGKGYFNRGIRAQKVVFLTATPIKDSLDDLARYSDIARILTHPKQEYGNEYTCFNFSDSRFPRKILFPTAEPSPAKARPQDLICATFDPTLPFTRYFKDTIRALNLLASDGTYPHRRLAQAWLCEPETRPQVGSGSENEAESPESRRNVVLKNINSLYDEAPQKNRFLIFVRWVKKNVLEPGCSAEELESFFLSHGFVEFEESGSKEKTVAIVTGRNSGELDSYNSTDPKKVPTILIVNYQVGQQGVNLPGYNHVINYHISASPAALEQRFGRIDRLVSTADEIRVFFPLLNSYPDNSTLNFYSAVSAYIQQHLPALPSRNALLTEKMLDLFQKNRMKLHEEAVEIKNIYSRWDSDAPWKKILKHLDALEDLSTASEMELTPEEVKVAKFIASVKDETDRDQPENKRVDDIKEATETKFNRWASVKEISEEMIAHCKKLVHDAAGGEHDSIIGNEIFYINGSLPNGVPPDQAIIDVLATIHPTGEDSCEDYIKRTDAYKVYEKELQEQLNKLGR